MLTRLHARYDSKALGEDLVFKKAEPIAGGREYPKKDGTPQHGAQKSSRNQFQARYAIRHPWKGEVKCDEPRFGRWGGPPKGVDKPKPRAATDLAFAERGKVKLASLIRQDVPELALKPNKANSASTKAAPEDEVEAEQLPVVSRNCLCHSVASARRGDHRGEGAWPLGLLAGLWLLRRRR